VKGHGEAVQQADTIAAGEDLESGGGLRESDLRIEAPVHVGHERTSSGGVGCVLVRVGCLVRNQEGLAGEAAPTHREIQDSEVPHTVRLVEVRRGFEGNTVKSVWYSVCTDRTLCPRNQRPYDQQAEKHRS
jgi:hypothetical protein